jgi:(p)ppGpp synthase/HD superfamily hydrolase
LLKRQVYQGQLVVFGRAGLIARLSGGATVRDYPKRYHPDSSPELQVRVNGEPLSRDHRLHDGDSIETMQEEAAEVFPGQPLSGLL